MPYNRLGENIKAKTMSKYEKQAWTVGMYTSLGVVLLCIYHHPFVTDGLFRTFAMLGFWAGFYIASNLWMPILTNHSEMENQIAYKATAWTFYGAVVIAGALTCFLLPKEISRYTFGIITIYTVFVFVGVRFILLAYLLRKERLSRSEVMSPHPNPLPEGEGKNDRTV